MKARSWIKVCGRIGGISGAFGAAACAHDPSAAVVVATGPAAAGACPFGGSVVSSGADANGNGVLDPGEVATQTTVCNDPPVATAPTVMRLVAEPAGMHCALAGTAVETGPDLNGNSVLDDDEVTHIDYACGEPLLTRLVASPPDAQCAAGGLAYLAGRDRNHNGQLEDAEVEERDVSCGDVATRDLAIHDAADAAALAGLAVIAGSLTVDDTALTELALPNLLQIYGGVEITRNAGLSRVSLPALSAVGGSLVLAQDPALTEIALPQLGRTGGLVVDSATALHDLGGLAALTEVTGDVQISHDDALAALALPDQRVGGNLAIDSNAQLARIAMAVPGRVGTVHIGSNGALTSVDLAGTAAGPLTELGAVTIVGNHQLAHVALGADEIAALAISDSPQLTDVAVTAVQVDRAVSLVGVGELHLAFSALAPGAFTVGSLDLSGPVVAVTSSQPLVVAGDATFDQTLLTMLGPDQVSRVGVALTVSSNAQLTAIANFPVAHGIVIDGNPVLTELGLQPGEEMIGDLTITNNAILPAAAFEGLRLVIGYVTVAGNPALKVLAPSLEQVSGYFSISSSGFTEVGLSHLQSAGGIGVSSCGSLTTLDLPALTATTWANFEIVANPVLQHLHLPALQGAEMDVLDNPHLPTCEVAALFARISGRHQQSGNDSTAGCTP